MRSKIISEKLLTKVKYIKYFVPSFLHSFWRNQIKMAEQNLICDNLIFNKQRIFINVFLSAIHTHFHVHFFFVVASFYFALPYRSALETGIWIVRTFLLMNMRACVCTDPNWNPTICIYVSIIIFFSLFSLNSSYLFCINSYYYALIERFLYFNFILYRSVLIGECSFKAFFF